MALAIHAELGHRIAKRLGGDTAAAKVVGGWSLDGVEFDGEVPATWAIQQKASIGVVRRTEESAHIMASGVGDELGQRAWRKNLQSQFEGRTLARP